MARVGTRNDDTPSGTGYLSRTGLRNSRQKNRDPSGFADMRRNHAEHGSACPWDGDGAGDPFFSSQFRWPVLRKNALEVGGAR
jgi:hypothetical protein